MTDEYNNTKETYINRYTPTRINNYDWPGNCIEIKNNIGWVSPYKDENRKNNKTMYKENNND